MEFNACRLSEYVISLNLITFLFSIPTKVLLLPPQFHNASDILKTEYTIRINSHIDRLQWTQLVQTSPTGSWFQTPDAYDFFASLPHLFLPFAVALYACSENQKDTLRAVCVGFVTMDRNSLMQFFTRRAIINGGPALANDSTDEEVVLLMQAVRNHFSPSAFSSSLARSPIYIETRNFNDFGRWKTAFEKAAFQYMPHLNFHVDCSDSDTVWNNLSENRRRQIRKAQKNGVQIVEPHSEQEIADWYHILHDLYRTKVKTPLFPVEFFHQFYRLQVGRFLFVKYEGNVVGGIMCPIWEDKCIYEWYVCGNEAAYRHLNPSVMATYAAMQYGSSHDLRRFDLMGAGKPDEPYGVRDFKSEFGGQLVEQGRFLYISHPLLYKIGTLGVKLLKKKKIF